MKIVPSRSQYKSYMTKANGILPDIKPFWTVDTDSVEAIEDWFRDTVEALMPEHNDLVQSQDKKREFYAGIQSQAYGKVGIPRDRISESPTSPYSKVVVNKLYNHIETWVAKLTRYAPNVVVNPANSESSDRVSAKLGKLIADNLAYNNDVEDLLERVVRMSRIDGETYLFVDWNKNIGDYKFTDAEAVELGMRKLVVDSEGEPILGVDGEPLYIEERERIGDAQFNQVESRFVMLEPRDKYKDCDWCIRLKIRYLDQVKAEFPDMASELEGGEDFFDVPWIRLSEHECIEWTFYHRSIPELESGAELRFCNGRLLSKSGYTFNSCKQMLPCVRYTCIDLPGVLRGVSILDNLLVLQVMYNAIYSLAYTNISLGAHMYWLVPTQANVDITKLRNSSSVLRYTGPVGPRIETFRTVGAELFNILANLDNLMLVISGHQGISQGDPPPGVDAAIALGVLEEQENQRANPEIKKYNTFIRKMYTLGLGRAQDNYKTSDGRLLRIVGKGNQDTIKALDMSKFSGSYDVRVQRSTALSESKNLRLQQLMLMKQNFPTAISDARFLDLMELGDEGKFYDIVAAATRAAEYENERFFSQEDVSSATPWEDHIAHWNVHMPFINGSAFKEDLPAELQQVVFDHILTTEYFMYQQAIQSPMFLAKVIALEQYPKFYTLPMPLQQIQMLVAQGVDPEKIRQQLAASASGGPMGAPAAALPQETPTAPAQLQTADAESMQSEAVPEEMRPDANGEQAAMGPN